MSKARPAGLQVNSCGGPAPMVIRAPPSPMPAFYSDEHIRSRIHLIRGHLVVLQPDLGRLFGVTENRLLAHARRFPGHFCFQLEASELLIHSNRSLDPWEEFLAFTEHGTMVMAYRLATPRAVAMSGQILRAFVATRRHETRAPGQVAADGHGCSEHESDPVSSARTA